jgi:hypothetical protein
MPAPNVVPALARLPDAPTLRYDPRNETETRSLLVKYAQAVTLALQTLLSPSTGRAVLVAGSATVSTADIRDDSNVQLTAQVAGGTPGFLVVGARVAGTSFVITSSNVADTSTVGWEIRRP